MTQEPIDELIDRLKALLEEKKEEVIGQIVHNHVVLQVPENQRHFWSPQLSLSLEEAEQGTRIRGLYGPAPNVWLLFMFIYFFLGFVTLVVLIVGLSRYNLGLSSYILWLIPFLGGGFVVLWLSGKAGKKIGHDQIYQIHNLIKPTILSRAVDEEDWGG